MVKELLALIAVLSSVAIIMTPGLTGAYILDDVPNLIFLSDLNRHFDWPALVGHVFSNDAGGTGRPVSLFSFALQHVYWPETPYAFKLVNLLIHLFNGILLLILLYQVGRLLGWAHERAGMFAILAGFVWMVHPIQSSTVFYIVQRMAELSATFVFLGLICYLHGRSSTCMGDKRRLVWMSAGVVVFGALAVLSKENGVLLLGFVLLLEKMLLRSTPAPAHFRLWMLLLIYLPLAAGAIYFIANFGVMTAAYAGRDFTLEQRLLTEWRVVADYLGKIVFPTPSSFVFFYENYPISTGLLTPPSTLLACLSILVLLGVAYFTGRKLVILSLGISWYFVAHLLESTVIPLELYFEHRNYVALVGPAMILGYVGVLPHASRKIERGAKLAVIVFLCGLCWVSWKNAVLWGDSLQQAATWATYNPNSMRTQGRLATLLSMEGKNRQALQVYRVMSRVHPTYLGGMLYEMSLSCVDKTTLQPSLEQVIMRAQVADYTEDVISLGILLTEMVQEKRCGEDSAADLEAVMHALLGNPRYKDSFSQSKLFQILAGLQLAMGRVDDSVATLDRMHARQIRPDVAIRQSRLLLSVGRVDEARKYLQKAEKLNAQMGYPRNLMFRARLNELQHEIDSSPVK